MPHLLERGLRPKAIVLGGEDFEDEFAGLSPSTEPSAWWGHHRFLIGGWRIQLEAAAKQAGVPVLHGTDPYALLPDTTALVVAGYSRRVPNRVTERYGAWALNVHPSLLPSFGGPQPEVQVILQEQLESGASVHTMTPVFDDGPLRAQRAFPLTPDLVVADIEANAAALGAECIAELLSQEQLPSLAPTRAASYFKWLTGDVADLSGCPSVAEAKKRLRLRPEIYAYFTDGHTTIYPISADGAPRPTPALSLPDGKLYCSEWVQRGADGSLSHHRN